MMAVIAPMMMIAATRLPISHQLGALSIGVGVAVVGGVVVGGVVVGGAVVGGVVGVIVGTGSPTVR